MLKRALFLIFILFLASWRPSEAQDSGSAESIRAGDSARVIYQARDRIYIDKGSLDGIDHSWQIIVQNPRGDSIYLSLSWIGDDLSYFSKPDSLSYSFGPGKVLALLKSPDHKQAGRKITIAYPHVPAMPHEGSVDCYDREFQSLISSPLQIKPLNSNENQSVYDTLGEIAEPPKHQTEICLFQRSKDEYCNSTPVGISDAYYTLQYYKKHPVPEAYGLKYLPPLDNPLYIYWDTTMQTCMPSQAMENGFNEIFNSARMNILRPAPGIADISQYSLAQNPDQAAFSPPGYGSTYGPYYISEYNNDQITLLRDINCGGNHAFPDTIVIKIETDYLKRKLMFQLGEIDLLDLNFSDVEQFENSYRVKQANLNEAAYLTVNNIKPLLSDGILSTTLSYLINKDGLCRIALGRSAIPMDNLIGKWSRDIPPMYKYDKNKGQSLIKNMSAVPRYLSLYISPDDFLTRRTAEYIKGILERQNIYVTIYSKMMAGEGRSYDLFQQFDMMIGRIDLSLDDPMYILNQTAFHYDMNDITKNRSLYYSQNADSIMTEYLQDPDANENLLKDYYRSLVEFPAGLPLFRPVRQVAASGRIKNFEFTGQGFIDFSSIEIEDETER